MTQLMPHTPIMREEKREDPLAQRREVNRRIDEILRGAVNWVGEVVLDAGAIGTTVEDDRITENSQVSLTAITLEAAAIASKCFVSAVRAGVRWNPNKIGEFVIQHPAPAGGKCAFRYSVKG